MAAGRPDVYGAYAGGRGSFTAMHCDLHSTTAINLALPLDLTSDEPIALWSFMKFEKNRIVRFEFVFFWYY